MLLSSCRRVSWDGSSGARSGNTDSRHARLLAFIFGRAACSRLVEISVLIAAIASFRGYHFGSLSEHGASIWKWALFWALFFVVVGLFEEFAFRGYLQFTLADGIGFWPAACVLSLGFGLLHRLNPGETWTGAASVAMIALIFALALKRTGNLWFVVGWHAAFDFGETFLFSVPNSGGVFEGHLSNATMAGPEWLTGGSVGPEGSIFSFLDHGRCSVRDPQTVSGQGIRAAYSRGCNSSRAALSMNQF